MVRRRWIPVCLTAGLFLSALAVPSLGATTPRTSSPLPEFGIGVTINDDPPLPDNQEMAQAQSVFSYVASLGADSVSINFPFYMASQSASSVYSGSGTPSPAALKGIIEIAEENGLSVQLRPLMSEADFDTPITGEWRGSIVPSNVGAWFTSYWNWLEPYLIVAKQTDVESFAIGSELNTLVSAGATTSATPGAPVVGIHNWLPYWLILRHEVQSIIGDKMVYAASHLLYATIPGVQFGYDAYYPVTIPAGDPPPSESDTTTTVNEFAASMEKSFQSDGFAATLSSTRLEEVGIAAAANAWTQPNDFNYPSDTPIERWVQADWDSAMCDTFMHYNMTGLYFWDVNFNGYSPSYNASDSLYDFEKTATETAIRTCFAEIRAAH